MYMTACITSDKEHLHILDVYSESHINVRIMDTDKQENASDCGIYSLAFSTALCAGEDPQCLQFIQSLMRQHLLKCLNGGKMEPFPNKKSERKEECFEEPANTNILHMHVET